MAVPEYISSEKNNFKLSWTNGLKNENGQLNCFGIHAYVTLAVNIFYFFSNSAFWIWGNIWSVDSDILVFLFEDILLVLDVLIWFTYLPYCIFSIIFQIVGIIKLKKTSGLFFVNLILSAITPYIIVKAMSQCF